MDASTALAGSGAEPNWVWCIETDGVAGPNGHRHVVAIEASGADERRSRWTIVQVIAAIRDGALFVVGGGGRAQAAVLEPSVCAVCQRATVVTDPPTALEMVPVCP